VGPGPEGEEEHGEGALGRFAVLLLPVGQTLEEELEQVRPGLRLVDVLQQARRHPRDESGRQRIGRGREQLAQAQRRQHLQ